LSGCVQASSSKSDRGSHQPSPPPAPSRDLTRPRPAPPPPQKKNQPTKQAQKVLEKTLQEAQETCDKAGSSSDECAVAFDNVEEVSAAVAHKKQAAASSDPLEAFCDDNPDADECRVYDD